MFLVETLFFDRFCVVINCSKSFIQFFFKITDAMLIFVYFYLETKLLIKTTFCVCLILLRKQTRNVFKARVSARTFWNNVRREF